jgi:glutamate dehydrogenase (NAD(P)+)
VKETGVVQGFSGATDIEGHEVLVYKADVLIPAAMEEAITAENAGDVQAQIIVEAANGPLTAEAHDIVVGRGVTVIPDILANAGGVTVSYFEWTQNIQQFRWEESRVVAELDKMMRAAYRSVAEIARRDGIDMRTAAFVLAIKRVARAAASRRAIRQHLPPSLLD